MGKYNGNTLKLDDILSRLEALEKANNELRKENAEFRKENDELRHKSMKHRVLIDDIDNTVKARELFSYVASNGRIVKDVDGFKNNFGVFYQNIFRALNPSVRYYKKGETLIYTPVSELSDEAYKIHLETLEDIIDTIYDNKKKLEVLNNAK